MRWVNAMSNGIQAAVARFVQQRRTAGSDVRAESFEEEEIFD